MRRRSFLKAGAAAVASPLVLSAPASAEYLKSER